MGWESAAYVQALPVQVQVQEQNQWSDEGRIGTSILHDPSALLTPFSPLIPIRLRHPLGPSSYPPLPQNCLGTCPRLPAAPDLPQLPELRQVCIRW